MNTVKSVSWTRMAMAFAAVLLVGGSGLVLAATPDATYIPKSASLSSSVGTTVPKGTKSNLTLTVVFDKGTFTFPTDTPAVGATLAFSAIYGTTAGNVYTAPAAGTTLPRKDRITGTYTQNGVSVISSLTVNTP